MSSVQEKKKQFLDQSKTPTSNLLNPFTETWDNVAGKEAYGRPPEGSLTEARGIKAHLHVHKEIEELCGIIKTYGREQRDGWVITFGNIFQIYVAISDKVVGLLLRARKHGLVDFEGEMLFQHRDEGVRILLRREPRTPVHSRSPSPFPQRSSPSPAPH